MPEHTRFERTAQNRGITLFTDPALAGCLGHRSLDKWHKSTNNRPIEVDTLRANLKACGYSDALNFTSRNSAPEGHA
jgi:hypothetical protein